METRPQVVAPAQRAAPAIQQTSGMRREQAFVDHDRWIGLVKSAPQQWSGWHHHGETDTYLYVLQGQLEIEYGVRGATVGFGPQDFVHVPHQLVHRERVTGDVEAQVVLVRIGSGPAVVNVDGPSSS